MKCINVRSRECTVTFRQEYQSLRSKIREFAFLTHLGND